MAKDLKENPHLTGSWAMMILAAMQYRPTFYYGTVPYDERLKRRARNRVARRTRKANRRSGAAR